MYINFEIANTLAVKLLWHTFSTFNKKSACKQIECMGKKYQTSKIKRGNIVYQCKIMCDSEDSSKVVSQTV